MITTDYYRLLLVLIIPIGRRCTGLTLSEPRVLCEDMIQPLVLRLVFPQVHLLDENLPAVATGVGSLARMESLVYFFVLLQ